MSENENENEREIFEITRGFVVRITGGDQVGDLYHAVVEPIGVDDSDAFFAAAAILEPLLKRRPEIACRTIGSLVSLADHRTCDDCDGEIATCPFVCKSVGETEGH
jgi:hypothetical protein